MKSVSFYARWMVRWVFGFFAWVGACFVMGLGVGALFGTVVGLMVFALRSELHVRASGDSIIDQSIRTVGLEGTWFLGTVVFFPAAFMLVGVKLWPYFGGRWVRLSMTQTEAKASPRVRPRSRRAPARTLRGES